MDNPGIELEDREQFDGGDAEMLKIRDLLDQARIRASFVLCDTGTGMRVKTRTCISYTTVREDGSRERSVPFPIVGVWVHNHALHGRGSLAPF